MSHDLEAINSAIRLGYRVVPPIGTVCFWVCDELGRVGGIRVKGGVFLAQLANPEREEVVFPRDIVEFVEILSVPDDAPPFEEWERP